jgi:hypothetical protein
MPGSYKNEWLSYLNGGTSQYNFSYTTPGPQTPIVTPTIHNMPNQPNTPIIKNKKKYVGGKRYSRRHTKKYRHSHRK